MREFHQLSCKGIRDALRGKLRYYIDRQGALSTAQETHLQQKTQRTAGFALP